jgi:hypothetical protein
MMVYGHASMLPGLGGDAESEQLRCGEAYGCPAQYRAALGPTTVRTTKQQKQTVADAAVQQWAGFADKAGVSGQVSVPRWPVFFYPFND